MIPLVVNANEESLVVGEWRVERPANVGDVTGFKEHGRHVVMRWLLAELEGSELPTP